MKRVISLFCIFNICVALVAEDLRLWYTAPARTWVEALPVGNSRMGAMVYGGTEYEQLQLNEETFWAGGPHNNNNPKLRENLANIRSRTQPMWKKAPLAQSLKNEKSSPPMLGSAFSTAQPSPDSMECATLR